MNKNKIGKNESRNVGEGMHNVTLDGWKTYQLLR